MTLGLSSVDDGDAAAVGDSLVTDCARVRSLGVLIGESEGDFGESGEVREVCWGILMFLWGRNNLGWSFNFFLFALFLEVGRVFGTVLVFLGVVP